MSDAERKAMEWLDGQLGYSLVQPATDTLTHLLTLKGMLVRTARPTHRPAFETAAIYGYSDLEQIRRWGT